ncbi:Tn3 family transposase [Microvirga aerilata]|uniref:Tn3 family transposase n=1 Tax=Microvirga aerilata TaxID=670292 RepID=A0A936ZCL3_9HYPH|nr:Tn3 family transposase [Microvirga aerilata]MBL0407351.1 Tn3 family transposase [Microvirga aerilata]
MAQRGLLTEDEHQLLFGVPRQEHLIIKHYTLSPDDLDLVLRKRGARNQLGFAVQLCLLRHPGFGLRLNEAPSREMLTFLASQLQVSPHVFEDYSRRPQTRLDHAAELMARFNLRPAMQEDWPLMLNVAAEAAWATDNGVEIVQAVLDWLRDHWIILPAPARLERLARAGRALARRRAAEALLAPLTEDRLKAIDALLVNDATLKRTPLAWLRDIAEAPSTANMAALLERLTFVRSLQISPEIVDRVHERRFQQFVREGAVAPAFLLDEYSVRRRRATLVAQIIELEAKLADAAIGMFDRLVGGLFTRARRRQERAYQTTGREVSRLMRLFHSTITALSTARATRGDPFEIIDEGIGWSRLIKVQPHVEELAQLADGDTLVMAAAKFMTVRRFALPFLDAFTFRSTSRRNPVLAALNVVRESLRSRRRDLPQKPPLSFLPKTWQQLIMDTGQPDRRLYETAVFAVLRDRLRSGDIWVEGTRNYQRFDTYLLPPASAPSAIADLKAPDDADAYLAERSQLLEWRLKRFARGLSKNAVPGVSLRGEELHVTPLRALTPPEADRLDRDLDLLMPNIRITELLNEVAQATGFARCFTDLRDGRPADDVTAVLAAVLADATNLGIERMADASQGVTKAQLTWVHSWYLREETYKAAFGAIVDAHQRLPLAALWGDGSTSSSDGQFFRTGRRSAGAGEVNAKYGSDPGVKFYTHLSDQYGPFHTKVISATTSEAPHVLDGLLHHGTGLSIHEHYTDTGGATDHVFGLCHLLGFRFVPRLRDLKDRRLATMVGLEVPSSLQPLMGRPIRADVVRQGWDEVLQLAASLKAGTVAPSVMLKKLSAYKRQNRVDLALQEIGRIERSLFTLDWLENPDLRRRCHVGLNKGEARNSMTQAIFAHKQGRITDRTFENQSYRASGLNLVIAAIVYWNTLYMGCAVEHLRSQGWIVPDELLTHVAPLGWRHISLTGDYLWQHAVTGAGQQRPLRNVRHRSAA